LLLSGTLQKGDIEEIGACYLKKIHSLPKMLFQGIQHSHVRQREHGDDLASRFLSIEGNFPITADGTAISNKNGIPKIRQSRASPPPA
jgi:hypothetical protein